MIVKRHADAHQSTFANTRSPGSLLMRKQATDDVLNFKYEYRDGYRFRAKEHTDPARMPSDDNQTASCPRGPAPEPAGGRQHST
jgi:hypothetical protein